MIPYKETTNTKKTPKNTLVLKFANASNPIDSFAEKICVSIITAATKIKNVWIENMLKAEVIIKNHNENPNVTVSALNLNDETCILDRINHCYKASLGEYG